MKSNRTIKNLKDYDIQSFINNNRIYIVLNYCVLYHVENCYNN